MKCLLSGSNGFIGKHLTKTLTEKGYDVVGIPRDIFNDPDKLLEFFKKENPDYIFHLAAYGNLASQTDIPEIVNVNIGKTFNLLMASCEIPYKLLINVSTSSVLLDKATFYSASKACGEQLCYAFIDQFEKPIITVRPSTVIGRGEPQEHLIPTLIRSCLYGEEMPFVSEPTHDFIDVQDVADALILLTENEDAIESEYNISNNRCYTNAEIKEIVEKITGKKANVKYVTSLRNYDNEDWVVDNLDLSLLGWEPQKTVAQSIMEMIREYILQ